jgi:hypothetical protein
MFTRSISLFLLGMGLVVAAAETAADSYRCGRKLIRSGDSAANVLRVCGAPQHKDSGREELWYQGTRQSLSVQRWYYRKSRRSLQHVVLLHKGKVVAIDVSGR